MAAQDVLPVIGGISDFFISGLNVPFGWVLNLGGINISIGDIACMMMIVVEIYVFLNDILGGDDEVDDGEPLVWYFFGDSEDHISGWWK